MARETLTKGNFRSCDSRAAVPAGEAYANEQELSNDDFIWSTCQPRHTFCNEVDLLLV